MYDFEYYKSPYARPLDAVHRPSAKQPIGGTGMSIIRQARQHNHERRMIYRIISIIEQDMTDPLYLATVECDFSLKDELNGILNELDISLNRGWSLGWCVKWKTHRAKARIQVHKSVAMQLDKLLAQSNRERGLKDGAEISRNQSSGNQSSGR